MDSLSPSIFAADKRTRTAGSHTGLNLMFSIPKQKPQMRWVYAEDSRLPRINTSNTPILRENSLSLRMSSDKHTASKHMRDISIDVFLDDVEEEDDDDALLLLLLLLLIAEDGSGLHLLPLVLSLPASTV